MRFVVVTGMSGGGKRTALQLLEDAGFYCVDNLPVSLVEKFVEDHYDEVFRYYARRLPSKEDAQDAT